MNISSLSSQLDAIATNVAKKGIFIVTKSDDVFAIQEHFSKKIVADSIPMKCIATYLCNLRNKGKQPSMRNKIKIELLTTQYFRFRTDIVFYKNTLNSTKDFVKYEVTEARLLDTICKFNFTKDELKRFR